MNGRPADTAPDGPNIEERALVRQGYDRCAETYDLARCADAGPGLTLLTDRLPSGASVLDVGCGAGVPVTRTLAERYDVTGVDISTRMLCRARANVPGARFILGDIMSVELAPAQFGAVVAFYAIFHLPRKEHGALLGRIHRWLVPGGYLLATLSATAEAPYTGPFHGVTMYWNSYGLETYQRMLREAGYELLATQTIGHGYADDYSGAEEQHPLVLARKTERDPASPGR